MSRETIEAYLTQGKCDVVICRDMNENTKTVGYTLKVKPASTDEWLLLKNSNPPKRALIHKTAEPFLKFLKSLGMKQCKIKL